MRRRIAYGIVILVLAAIVALLWVHREPRPLPSPLEPFRVDDWDRVHQELEEVGIQGMRARALAATARLEKQRKMDQLQRQNTYVILVLALVVIVAVARMSFALAARRRARVTARTPTTGDTEKARAAAREAQAERLEEKRRSERGPGWHRGWL